MTPDAPRDPEPRTITLSRGPLSLTDEGTGPAIVLLHGVPGSVRDYRWLAVGLEGLRVIRLDEPGFGATPARTEHGASVPERAGAILEAAEVLGLTRFAVLGHSMGGPLAMEVARRAADRVTKLILLASVGLRPHRLWRRLHRRPELAPVLDWPLVGARVAGALRARMVAQGFPSSTTIEAAAQTMRIVSRLRFDDVRAAARGVRAPAMLAWTEDDAWVESSIALELGALLPAGPRVAYADGGHNLQKTCAIELAKEISAFVAAAPPAMVDRSAEPVAR